LIDHVSKHILEKGKVKKEIEDIEMKMEVFEGLFFFIIQNHHHLKGGF